MSYIFKKYVLIRMYFKHFVFLHVIVSNFAYI